MTGRQATTAIFRYAKHSRWCYLKIKSKAAWRIFHDLRQGNEVTFHGRNPNHQIRHGRHLAASTRNIADKVVVEIRFRKQEGGPATLDESSPTLFHSLIPDRRKGLAHIQGDLIVVGGRAGRALARALGLDQAEVFLHRDDPTSGALMVITESIEREQLAQ